MTELESVVCYVASFKSGLLRFPGRTGLYFPHSRDHKAEQFEKYLKHGSGHAFANRHFW
jgi:hypothetical protein